MSVSSNGVERYENVIVGAGPAGLQMGYHLQQAGRSYLILEAGEQAGTFFERFPRHRTLLSINKRFNRYPELEFNLRHDWNSILSDRSGPRFTSYSEELFPHADDLVRYLNDYARAFALNLRVRARVCSVQPRPEGGFRLTDESGRTYHADRMFLATGAVRPWVPPDVEGIDLAEGYEDHSIDRAGYVGQRVAIIGRGNSAFEVANHLAGHAAMIHLIVARRVKFAWNTHYPGDLRAINNTVIDMYHLKSLHAMLGLDVRAIRKRDDSTFELQTEERVAHWDPPVIRHNSYVYDRVIRCTGWRYAPSELFEPGSGPRLDRRGRFFELDASWQTTVPGLYCIGTSMQCRDRKAATSFIHGFRYNVRTLFRLLEERHYGVAYPTFRVQIDDTSDLDRLTDTLLRRVSTTSALFQQFGVLCDAMVFRNDEMVVHPELPVDYVLQREGLGDAEDLVLLTLEYGFHRFPTGASPVDFLYGADPSRPDCSAFLHPVLRHYRRGVLEADVHFHESFEVRYDYESLRGNDVLGHKNRIKNLLNSITRVSPDTYVEGRYAGLHHRQTHEPWPGEAPTPMADPHAGCRFVTPPDA